MPTTMLPQTTTTSTAITPMATATATTVATMPTTPTNNADNADDADDADDIDDVDNNTDADTDPIFADIFFCRLNFRNFLNFERPIFFSEAF